MSRNSIHLFLIASVFLAVPLQAQENEARLLWKNGDVLPGTLLESESGQIRWSSPFFLDDLVVETEALKSILFAKQSVQSTEAFLVRTISGDVFTADIVGADDDTFLFSSERFGRIRLNRNTVYTVDRLEHPNLIFDGTRYNNWETVLDGPIKDLTYKVYDFEANAGGGDANAQFPDFTKHPLIREGNFKSGYLDLGLAGVKSSFGMVFDGQLDIEKPGEHQFTLWADDMARLFIDDELAVEFLEMGRKPEANGNYKSVQLGMGFHSIRVEFIERGGGFRLVAGMTGPDFKRQSLVKANNEPAWKRGPGGHPYTGLNKARIIQKLEWPENFEIDLEFSSTAPPRFILSFGKILNKSMRLETWDNELMIVQNNMFEQILTIEEEQRHVLLRLAYKKSDGAVKVFDVTGRLLVTLSGVRPAEGESGIYIHNRGQDMTIRRLRVYRQSDSALRQRVDSSKPHVYMIDGQAVYGRLYVDDDGAYVFDSDRIRRNIDLDQAGRIVNPDVKLTVTVSSAELLYTDGTAMRGQIERADSNQVILRTAFSDLPVTCLLAGASKIQFGPPVSGANPPSGDSGQLISEAGRLRGRLSFDMADAPLSWEPEGVVKSLRLDSIGKARIERSIDLQAKELFYDENDFPSLLHLKNGEIIPCQVLSYNEKTCRFFSPFISVREMEAAHVKAVEFNPPKGPNPYEKSSSEMEDWLVDTLGIKQTILQKIDPVKLEHSLTVPRFNRHNPPSHILTANNGDFKRGKLLAIDGNTIQFESKLRKIIVPISRMAHVVNISKPEDQPGKPGTGITAQEGTVRARLNGGSILVFKAVESKDGKLIGRSSIYGDVEIPTGSIQSITFGDFEIEEFKSVFDGWIVRPSREPEYAKPTP